MLVGSLLTCHLESLYTQAQGWWSWGLWFIGDYNLKPLWQICSTDSNVNLLCDNDFFINFSSDYDMKMSKIYWPFLTYTEVGGHIVCDIYNICLSITNIIYYFRIQTTTPSQRGVWGINMSNLEGNWPPELKMAIFYTPSCQTGGHIVYVKRIPMTSISEKPLGTGDYNLKISKINQSFLNYATRTL